MPGIAGIAGNRKTDENLLDDMLNSVKHKDFHKIDKFCDFYAGIGRVHLGIFNPEEQPIFNEDKSLCIFMDGKIYDYDKELEELKQKGHKFNVENDPEFCLHLYEEIGTDFVKDLNGQFVIVIYDIKEKKVIIVNDRYGLRPLYVNFNNLNTFFDDVTLNNEKKIKNINKLLFASEVKAILKDKEFKKEVNDEAVTDFFAFGKLLGNKTFFNGIETLPPASIFVYEDNEISIKRYWDFEYKETNLSEDELVDELVKNLRKAVDIRMKDDCDYTIALSGGLDSRSVIGAMNKNKTKDVLAFTHKMADVIGESEIARRVAITAGAKHINFEYSADDIFPYAKEVVYLTDGMNLPFISVCMYAIDGLRKKLGNHVMFQGLAADLSLGGSFLNESILNAKTKDEQFTILYLKMINFTENELARLFTFEYYNKIRNMPQNSLRKALKVVKEKNPGNRSDHFFMQNHVRRYTILGSIIGRNWYDEVLPTYDNDYINTILKIPPELRFKHKIYRKFLKKLSPELAKIPYNKTGIRADAPLFLWKVIPIFSAVIRKIKRTLFNISNGKLSFTIESGGYSDFEMWLRKNENWSKIVKDLLLDKNASSRRYFNEEYVKTLIKEHEHGLVDYSTKIGYLLSFELFLRMFVDN